MAPSPDTVATEAMLPARYVSRAHFAVSGELVQLPSCPGEFIVTQRIEDLKCDTAIRPRVLDVLVQDQD